MITIAEIQEFNAGDFRIAQQWVEILSPQAETLTESAFRGIIASPCSHLFFAREGETPAGMLTLGYYTSPTGMKAWIEDVVVAPAFQGQGIGKTLVEHAIRFASSAGADLLMLTSNPSRVAANRLYQALHFERKETNVYRMKLR